MGMIYTVFMIEKRPRKWLQISARMLGVMSTRMKALLSLFFLFPLVAFSQQQRVSESELVGFLNSNGYSCLLYTSPSPRDLSTSRMPSSA